MLIVPVQSPCTETFCCNMRGTAQLKNVECSNTTCNINPAIGVTTVCGD